jgi:hypothetical protein
VYIAGGIVQGAVDVFPRKSLISRCNHNLTSISDNYDRMKDNLIEAVTNTEFSDITIIANG